MKIVRSVLAILAGWLIAYTLITATDMFRYWAYRPPNAPALDDLAAFSKWFEAHEARRERSYADYAALPTSAFLLALGGWQLGAFVGGAVSAVIAGRARIIHAGVVGALVLSETVFNFLIVRDYTGFTHPDWMIVIALLLPMPLSLLAGKIVSLIFPLPPTPVPPS